MQVQTTLKQFGSSVGLVIPKALRDDLKFSVGLDVCLKSTSKGLMVTPLAKKKYSLDELLAQCDIKASVPPEVEQWRAMKRVGHEV